MAFTKMQTIPKGQQVLVVHDFNNAQMKLGVSDGKIIDKEYLSVDGELYYAAFIFPYSERIENSIKAYASKRKAAIDQLDKERYELLNSIRRGELC